MLTHQPTNVLVSVHKLKICLKTMKIGLVYMIAHRGILPDKVEDNVWRSVSLMPSTYLPTKSPNNVF